MANDQPDTQTDPSLGARGNARRRLTKAAVGAAGVLWTLESKAGMCSPGRICKAPSAHLSAGASTFAGKPVVCKGLSPGYWSKPNRPWPVRKDLGFGEVFPCFGNDAKTYGVSSMRAVMLDKSFDQYNLGRHLVANYLNVKAGYISFLTEEALVKMWREIRATKVYSPKKGVYWSAEELKCYLERTHD